eukprot:Clim_evm7s164 gene=Clim_evmTU7s164
MRVTRRKHARKHIQYYKLHHDFREPFQVIVDGTFAEVALKCRIQIAEQMPKYLSAKVKLFTTRCVQKEVASLGPQFSGARAILKHFEFLHCRHKDSNVSPKECIDALVSNGNAEHYCVASQDLELRKKLQVYADIPLFYINYNTILLQPPPKARSKTDDDIELKRLKLAVNAGQAGPKVEAETKKKRRGAKGPNPLSMLKKKKQDRAAAQQNDGFNVAAEGPRRKRKRSRRNKPSDDNKGED